MGPVTVSTARPVAARPAMQEALRRITGSVAWSATVEPTAAQPEERILALGRRVFFMNWYEGNANGGD